MWLRMTLTRVRLVSSIRNIPEMAVLGKDPVDKGHCPAELVNLHWWRMGVRFVASVALLDSFDQREHSLEEITN